MQIVSPNKGTVRGQFLCTFRSNKFLLTCEYFDTFYSEWILTWKATSLVPTDTSEKSK